MNPAWRYYKQPVGWQVEHEAKYPITRSTIAEAAEAAREYIDNSMPTSPIETQRMIVAADDRLRLMEETIRGVLPALERSAKSNMVLTRIASELRALVAGT